MSNLRIGEGLAKMGELVPWQGKDWTATWALMQREYPEIIDMIVPDRDGLIEKVGIGRCREWAKMRQPDGLPNSVSLDMPLLTDNGEVTQKENHDPRELTAFGCKQMVFKLVKRRANLDDDIRYYADRYRDITGTQLLIPFEPDETRKQKRTHRPHRPTPEV